MTNQNTFRRVRTTSPETWQGFTNARDGRPFPAAYDGWKESQQKNYERGRLAWFNIRLAGLKPPSGPTQLRQVRKRAIELVGLAGPP